MNQRPPVDCRVWRQHSEKVRQSLVNRPAPLANSIDHSSNPAEATIQDTTASPLLSPSASMERSVKRSVSSALNHAWDICSCQDTATAKVTQIVRRPFAVVGAAWLLSVCVGSIAAVSIFKIDSNFSVVTQQAEPQTIAASSPLAEVVASPNQTMVEAEQNPVMSTRQESTKETLPMLSLGIVALGCAVGCLMLSRHFHASPSKQQPQFPSRSRVPRIGTSSSRRAPRNRKGVLQVPGQFNPMARHKQSEPNSPSIAASVTVVPAVVPAQEDHPLDWDKASLADDLDIRQQRPLSRWL